MYKAEFSQVAAGELKKVYEVDRKLYTRIVSAIESLKLNPYQGKSLKGRLKGDFSLRIGTYRVIYFIQKYRLIVYIIDLGHRREIYR